MRNGALYALLLITTLIISCTPHCNQWKLAVIKADCPSATYAKAYLPACNTFSGLEAVLTSCNGSVEMHLNAFTLLFPYYDSDEEHSEVFVCIGTEKYSYVAGRLEGGQSLLLPEAAVQLITGALLESKCVDISVGRYQTTLIYQNFAKVYSSLTCS